MESAGMRPRGNSSRRRDARRNCQVGTRCVERSRIPRSVCAARTADALRFLARPGREAHGMGVLSCAERVDQRRVGRDRGPDRTLRAGLSLTYSAAKRDAPERSTSAKCEFSWRRCGRRRGDSLSTLHAAHMAALFYDGPAYLYLFGVNSPWWWRPRNVRSFSCQAGFAQVAVRPACLAYRQPPLFGLQFC